MTRRSSRKKLKRGSRSAQVGLWSQSSWSQSQGTLELHSRGGSQASSLLVLGHREGLAWSGDAQLQGAACHL